MTFHGRFNRFECDFCKQVVHVKTFPDGWEWIKSGIGRSVQHACPGCIRDGLVPEEDDAGQVTVRRKPGQIN